MSKVEISKDEAEVLMRCYVNESVRRYGHFKETPLAKKLDEIANAPDKEKINDRTN